MWPQRTGEPGVEDIRILLHTRGFQFLGQVFLFCRILKAHENASLIRSHRIVFGDQATRSVGVLKPCAKNVPMFGDQFL